ncbi:ribonuclease H-like domain-containing protein [Tanacetum coccineum]
MAGEDEFNNDNPPPPPPPPVTPTQQAPHTLSSIKLPILKKGEYDIWAMKMEHYLGHTDYPIWEVIQNGNGPVQVSTDTNGQIRVLPPKTTLEILARERERKARTTLLMSIPEDHLAKFHKMIDAKDIFSVSNSKGLHKGYDRFQSLLSQLVIHGAGVSTEDANQKFLRSLPTSWPQVSLIMRTKPGVDTLSFDDLYNNLRVFESDIKGSTASSSSTQNVAFVSSESTNSTNDVSTAYGVSTSSGYNSQKEEMDLKWQVAMISMRLKKFYKKTRRRLQFNAKELVGFDQTKVECFNCHNTWHFARECRSKGNQESRRRDARNTGYKAKDNGRRPRKQDEPKALVTLDGDSVDWTGHAEDEQENFALMAHSNLGSNTKVEAQLVCHQQNQLIYEEKIRFMKIDLDDKTNVLTYHKKLLAEAVKEKEELKTKLENFQSSSKGLSKLLNSQMSTRDKSGLGSSLMTGIYMPSKFDFRIDESKFTYGPKQSKTSDSDAKTSDTASCESNSSVETPDSVSKPTVNEPIIVSKSKVWSDAPIIEEYKSDSDDEYVIEPLKEQEKSLWHHKQLSSNDYGRSIGSLTLGLQQILIVAQTTLRETITALTVSSYLPEPVEMVEEGGQGSVNSGGWLVGGKNGYNRQGKEFKVLAISVLEGAASEWFKKDCIDSVTTWEDLVEKFVQKFYQLSDNNEEMEVDEDDDPDDIVDIFKIERNLFNLETPLCKTFNEFNYLLKIDTDLFAFDIAKIKTYEEYELNNNMIEDLEEPRSNNGDHKWYDELTDGKLKEEALMHKAIFEES